ncbi:hypothetical protein MMAG44476_25284 [Mycolicibacterium mageritense DSM 44476 = CIP 104973]|uniref:Sigma 54 modulation/S30EA ribosomal protein C-terminal domain-containing protein n=1 Tax=Mycolicibacterium mageritense TaxID=53462 RepID=A0ABM7I3K1_MYCME|nr:sigma 54 modulation/S30EA ribosomal C-terminal domain-containing protein [Mycobacterium sp. DSM 3803]TXI61941.1 MAG: HPF/RaiA family ribosome-associated protein [Mycolicibacterium mageritense]BBX37472.1 hypothetical protein MMAGJ_67540 [Mycolicibacterium mageritense]GJJ18068.1 hypothetical protein MTY414_17410 [Mycolicibacterium mageritense]
MRQTASTQPAPDIVVTAHGDLADSVTYVRDKIGRIGRVTRRPMTNVRVRLSRHGDPAVERPVIAQANLVVDGRSVRVQVEGLTVREAVDRLESRLRRRLEHVAAQWEWQHEPKQIRHRRFLSRPVAETRVIRRKSFSAAPCTVDDAVAEMNLLDYDFHLFTEVGTGIVGVIYRNSPAGYRLALVAPYPADMLAPFVAPVSLSAQPIPCLTLEAAVRRLDLLGLPFLFFIEAAEGRACVLYRRYDGHFGMITPAAIGRSPNADEFAMSAASAALGHSHRD